MHRRSPGKIARLASGFPPAQLRSTELRSRRSPTLLYDGVPPSTTSYCPSPVLGVMLTRDDEIEEKSVEDLGKLAEDIEIAKKADLNDLAKEATRPGRKTIGDITEDDARDIFQYHLTVGLESVNEVQQFLGSQRIQGGDITVSELRAQRPELFKRLPEALRESWLEKHG